MSSKDKDDMLILPWEEPEQTSDVQETIARREADRNRPFSKHRRSSILKVPSNQDNLTERIVLQEIKNSPSKKKFLPRRVSFSAAASVKEFRTGKEELTVWTSTYEENHDVSETLSINESNAGCRIAQTDKTNIFSTNDNNMDVTCAASNDFMGIDEEMDISQHRSLENKNLSSMDFTCDVKKIMENREEIRRHEKINNIANTNISMDFTCDVQKIYGAHTENPMDSLKKLNNLVNQNNTMDFTCGISNVLKFRTEQKAISPKHPDSLVNKSQCMEFTCDVQKVFKMPNEIRVSPEKGNDMVNKTQSMDFTCDVQKIKKGSGEEERIISEKIDYFANKSNSLDFTCDVQKIHKGNAKEISSLQQLSTKDHQDDSLEFTCATNVLSKTINNEKVQSPEQLSNFDDGDRGSGLTHDERKVLKRSFEEEKDPPQLLGNLVEPNETTTLLCGESKVSKICVEEEMVFTTHISSMDLTLDEGKVSKGSLEELMSTPQQLRNLAEKHNNIDLIESESKVSDRSSEEVMRTSPQLSRIENHICPDFSRDIREVCKSSSEEVMAPSLQLSVPAKMDCESIFSTESSEAIKVTNQTHSQNRNNDLTYNLGNVSKGNLEEKAPNTQHFINFLDNPVNMGSTHGERMTSKESTEEINVTPQQVSNLVGKDTTIDLTHMDSKVTGRSSEKALATPQQLSNHVEINSPMDPTHAKSKASDGILEEIPNHQSPSSPDTVLENTAASNHMIQNDSARNEDNLGTFAMDENNVNPPSVSEKVLSPSHNMMTRDLQLEKVPELSQSVKKNDHAIEESSNKIRSTSRLNRQERVDQSSEEIPANKSQRGVRTNLPEHMEVSSKLETDNHPNRLKRHADSHKSSHGGKERKNMIEVSAFDYFLTRQNQIPLHEDPLPHGRFELAEQNLRVGKVTFTFLHGSLALEIRLGFPLPAEEIEDGTSERKRTAVKHWTIRRIDFTSLLTGNENKGSKLAHFLLLRQLKSTWFHEKCPTTCTLRETLLKVSSYVNDSAKFILDMYMIQTSHFHFDVDDGHKVTVGFLNVELDLSFHIQIDFSKGFGAAKLAEQIQVQVLSSMFKLKSDSVHQLAKAVQPGWKFLKSFVNYIDTYCEQLSRKK